ncbi:MAG TPA: DUF1629 domain-containing protein [Actinomycetota bacterium]|nr:DUF1629 domain-containing protein [Actinomycetota bacterium]
MTVDAEFFLVSPVDNLRMGIARPERSLDAAVQEKLELGGWIDGWRESTYLLERRGFSDFQPASSGVRLCSARLRSALDAAKGASDVLQWLAAKVIRDGGEARPYWVLHFPEHPDVLDARRTVVHEGRVVKPVIDVAAARRYGVFGPPVATLVEFVVARAVRDAIRRAGCRGIRFTPVA